MHVFHGDQQRIIREINDNAFNQDRQNELRDELNNIQRLGREHLEIAAAAPPTPENSEEANEGKDSPLPPKAPKPSRKQSRTQHCIEYSRRLDMAAGNEPSPEHSENENASDNSDVRRAIDELNEEANRTAIYMSSSPSISTQFQTPRPRYQFIQDPTTSDFAEGSSIAGYDSRNSAVVNAPSGINTEIDE
jgi:hypothetical protein